MISSMSMGIEVDLAQFEFVLEIGRGSEETKFRCIC
jgi:hypothetical protein